MHHEHIFHPAPLCPSCGGAMWFVGSAAKIGEPPESQAFECRARRVLITEVHEPKVLEKAAPKVAAGDPLL
jgi:hypothetical protein